MLLFSVTLLCLAEFSTAFLLPYPVENARVVRGDRHAGGRVIITPYLKRGEVDKARKLTLVQQHKGNVTSYAGYVTVNATCDANLFFWFFPRESARGKAPVAVWLQGGPGASSMYGLFSEHGPFQLHPNNKIVMRKYPWTQVSSYLYIDNPVGTGYSYARSEECYSTNQVEVGRNLLSAVKQILSMFPEMASNPFYVTGESYAGKYVPALAYAIHTDPDTDPSRKINLQGIAIGNGLVDPYNQLHYSDYLYQLGLVDAYGREFMRSEEDKCRGHISSEKWMDAFRCFDDLLNGDMAEYPTFFRNATGFSYYFNYLYASGQTQGDISAYLTQDHVRESLHVGDAVFNDGKLVEKHLMEDVMKSVRPWLEELLEHYRVLIYNGQLDIIVAYPLTLGYLQKLKWSGAEEYKNASRRIWHVEDDVAGYVKTAGKLTEVLVRNAGHMVPMDQPKWSLDLISRFFNGKPFH